METKLVLLGVAAMLMIAVDGCPVGQEFLTAFMPNFKANHPRVSLQLAITAYKTKATVKVEVKSIHFSTTVQVQKWSTKRITLPRSVEIQDSGPSGKTVRISSDNDISVVAFNNKKATGDSSVVFPIEDLDTDYMIYTPNTSPSYMDKLVAVINGKDANTVEIFPHRNMKVRGNQYWQQAAKVAIKLAPYEVYQFRSLVTFTGTRLKAKHPVAVLAGHQCSRLGGFCTHVYEQLPPVQRLSTHFLVPVMRDSKDMVYVVAIEDNTKVNIATGKNMQTGNIMAGQMWNVCIGGKTPLVIDSDKKVMVMYYSSNRPYDPFFISILPSSVLSNEWSLDTQGSFRSTAIIVSEADGVKTIQFNDKKLHRQVKWRPFPTEHRFLWATVPLGMKQQHISITSDSLIAVYIYGGKIAHGYGTTGVCYKGSVSPPPPDPCESIKCREKEECQKGVCVHISKATCRAVGDPHYSTFDGKRFDFQGTCTYTMSTIMGNDHSLIPFTILTKNNNRGNKYVSFVRKVTITVYSETIAISNRRGMVEVNGVNSYLPATLAGGKLRVVHRGRDAVLTTEFGLEVKYDWNSKLYIMVPSSYFRALGGLCGNYNGNRQDEFTDPKGKKISTVLEFAKSWKVKDGDVFCNDDCRGKCPSCSVTLQEKYRRETFCGLMTQKDGAFSSCHKTLEPNMYVDNCVYDVCINKGIKRFLCDNIASYADACMAEGVKLTGRSWRDLANCRSGDPHYRTFDGKRFDFQGTCTYYLSKLVKTADPSLVPFEVRVQNQNRGRNKAVSYTKTVEITVYGNTIVLSKESPECGCARGGHYYKMGQVFFPKGLCKQRCVCQEGGEVQCKQGFSCGPNEKCQVDDIKMNLPLSLNDEKVKAYQSGFNIIVETDFGLKVSYDSASGTIIEVPSTYKGAMGGLCGNYNGNAADDFMLPSRVQAPSVEKFAEAWVSIQEGVQCQTGCGSQCPVPDKQKKPEAEKACSILTSKKGPFAQCHTAIPPQQHFALCVQEVITEQKYGNLLCLHIQKYVALCQAVAITVREWRTETFCSIECPSNSHYELCADTCSSTCASLSVSTKCPRCQEGCQCDDGYVFDGDLCIQLENCGCMVDGRYYKSGEAVTQNDCTEECSCEAGKFTCEPTECSLSELCEVRDGVMECYKQDPCENVKCREKEECHGGLCVHISKATCKAVGDPHYSTFDGKRYNFQGTCTYTMATTVDNDPGLIPFTILAKNDHRGNKRVSFVRTVTVSVYSQTIVISKNRGMVEVNGVASYLPLTLVGGKLHVVRSGRFAVLKTDFGLEVKYDWNMKLYISAPSSYFRTLGGLCGNYNGDRKDEFIDPKGKTVSTVLAFAKSWKSKDRDLFCHDDCRGKCPGCSQKQQKRYKRTRPVA
ncbi:hypothetical protein AAFF_G00204880 [Aldrovandia affinis]|uniref:VWFD domain-containing protein n=1 Tax=Aldrovandia affinis TaxID=143900 RepID=A0AAD7RI13_9TELE|nr:hypothetical protein AAFF_G00204880 [Aldrovandia affinis]